MVLTQQEKAGLVFSLDRNTATDGVTVANKATLTFASAIADAHIGAPLIKEVIFAAATAEVELKEADLVKMFGTGKAGEIMARSTLEFISFHCQQYEVDGITTIGAAITTMTVPVALQNVAGAADNKPAFQVYDAPSAPTAINLVAGNNLVTFSGSVSYDSQQGLSIGENGTANAGKLQVQLINHEVSATTVGSLSSEFIYADILETVALTGDFSKQTRFTFTKTLTNANETDFELSVQVMAVGEMGTTIGGAFSLNQAYMPSAVIPPQVQFGAVAHPMSNIVLNTAANAISMPVQVDTNNPVKMNLQWTPTSQEMTTMGATGKAYVKIVAIDSIDKQIIPSVTAVESDHIEVDDFTVDTTKDIPDIELPSSFFGVGAAAVLEQTLKYQIVIVRPDSTLEYGAWSSETIARVPGGVEVLSTIHQVNAAGEQTLKGSWSRHHIPAGNGDAIASAILLYKTDASNLSNPIVADTVGDARNQNLIGNFADNIISYNTINNETSSKLNTFRAAQLCPNATTYSDLGVAAPAGSVDTDIIPFLYEATQQLVALQEPTAGALHLMTPQIGDDFFKYYFTLAPAANGCTVNNINLRFKSLSPNSAATPPLSEFTALTITINSIADVETAVNAYTATSTLSTANNTMCETNDEGFMYGVNYYAELQVNYGVPNNLPTAYNNVLSGWTDSKVNSTQDGIFGTGVASAKLYKELEIVNVKAVDQEVHVTIASHGWGFPNNTDAESGENKMMAAAWKQGSAPDEMTLMTVQANTGFEDATSTGSARAATSYIDMNQFLVVLPFTSALMNFIEGQFDVLVQYSGNTTNVSSKGGPPQIVLCNFVNSSLQTHLDAISDRSIFINLSTLKTTLATREAALYGVGATSLNPADGSVEKTLLTAQSDLAVKEATKSQRETELAAATTANQPNLDVEAVKETTKDDATAARVAHQQLVSDALNEMNTKQGELNTEYTTMYGDATTGATAAAPAIGSLQKMLDDAEINLTNAVNAWNTANQPTEGGVFNTLVAADAQFEAISSTHAAGKISYDDAYAAHAAAFSYHSNLSALSQDKLDAENAAIQDYYAYKQSMLNVVGGTQLAYNNAVSNLATATTAADLAAGTLLTAENHKYNYDDSGVWQNGTPALPHVDSVYQRLVAALTDVANAAKPSGNNTNKELAWYDQNVVNAKNTSDLMTMSYKSQNETAFPSPLNSDSI